VASAAGYVSAVADALGINRFAVMGHSGGAPHALACGALLPDRVTAVVSAAGLAPCGAEGLVAPWGFDPAQVSAPVLLLHGGRDRVVPSAHISVLNSARSALEWLRKHVG
jgi:pimeloyl-ACP methyl ester carboxylesterase